MTGATREPVNPFPGPQPYRAADRDRFHGREAVGRELASMILAHRCVALFGPSGAGKSSVMQAAVIPALDEEYDFRHVAIDGWPADEEPVAWLLYTLHAQLKLVAPDATLGLYESVEWTVRQAFRRSDRPILIYLDQIEQLLFPGRAAAPVEAFLDWLDRFAEAPIRGLHLVLAMREDYLGRFRDRARGRHRLLENGFRLGPMTVGEIVGAVCQSARGGVPPQSWSPPAMRTLMLQVRVPGQGEADEAEVQTAFAQIVCRALFAERAAGGAATVDGPVQAEPILRGYLDNSLAALGPLRHAAEQLLEDQLVAADGTRTLLTEEAARAAGLATSDQLDVILTDLERAAILRAEQHRGTRYFELGHDWLAKKVHERKQERLARAAELAREREQAAQRRAAEEQLQKARAETRRARKVVAVVAAFGLLAVALGVFAWTQQQVARSEAERALQAEGEARAAEDAARAERDRANEASREAIAARERAEASLAAEQRAKDSADAAAKEALAQKSIAEEQRTAAVASETKAQVALVGQRRATKEAETQRGNAETSMRRAEDEARRARDANLLAIALAVLPADPTAALALLHEVHDPVHTRGWTPASVEALQLPVSQAVLRGHDGYVVAAAFSPDGSLVGTASHDHTARLARADGAGAGRALTGHEDEVEGLAFSPDGARVATASADGTVRLWSVGDGSEERKFTAGGPVTALAFSPDGRRIAAASRDGSARVFAVDGGPPTPLAGHTEAVRSIAFSPDGARVVTASDDGTARVWPIGQVGAPQVLRGHEGTVHAAAFSPDGRRVVTAGDDRTARIFQVGDSSTATRVLRGHADAVYTAAFSPSGDRIVTASRDRTARVWTLADDAPPKVLRGHADKVYVARWSPSGKLVATASRDGTARLWPVGVAGAPRVLRGHTTPVVDVQFARDGRRVVTAAEDGTARVWETADAHREQVLRGHTGVVRSVQFDADGGRLVTAADDRTARVWRVSGDRSATTALEGHGGEVLTAMFAGDRVVTGARDGLVKTWALPPRVERTLGLELAGVPAFVAIDAGRVLTSASDVATLLGLRGGPRTALRGHGGKILHGAISPDGARVVTAGDDRTARVWTADGSPAAVLRGHEGSLYHAAFSRDGARVVTASWDRTARVWSAAGGPATAVLFGHEKIVRSAEFSPDGLHVVTGSDDTTAKIWRSDGSGDVVTLYGHEGAVYHAAFSPDGRRVATASGDRTARVWAADFDDPALLRTRIRDKTSVCLVPEQRTALLGESAAEAAERHRDCESSAGR